MTESAVLPSHGRHHQNPPHEHRVAKGSGRPPRGPQARPRHARYAQPGFGWRMGAA